ncbi:MAG TPA: hypothetical protein VK153_03680 [Candidatus Paceibacterota bacterium]|nr:hypothetical protein [Candidatus Paceibacterota bacterium]
MDENKTQPTNKKLEVLRTYTSDMAEAVRTNEMSVIKIALAEKEKREQEDLYKKAEGTKFSKALFIIGGIILISFAVYGSYFLIEQKKVKEDTKTTIDNVETFISYDSKSYIDTTSIGSAVDLMSLIKKEGVPNAGLVKALFLTKRTETSSSLLTANDLLSLIESTAPGTLTRFLSDKFLLGEYTSGNVIDANENFKSGTFLIFQTTDYNQAYASMLVWEKTMLKDMKVLFNIEIPETDPGAVERQWKDLVISNKDARVIYDINGKGLLYYVFVNKNNFVIANNMETLKEVIARILIKNTPI